MKVTVGRYRARGLWYVNRWENGKRKRTFYRSKAEALAVAAKIRESTELPVFSAAELVDLRQFLDSCAEAKVNHWELLRSYRSGALAVQSSVPLGRLLAEFIAAKRLAGRSEAYCQNLQLICGRFVAGLEAKPAATVTLSDVETWLASQSAASASTLRARLSAMFSYAKRRGYCQSNPCEHVEVAAYRRAPVSYLTPEQTVRCLQWLRDEYPRGLAWFVLTTLAGLRPEEAQKTGWNAIAGGHVVVDAQTSKVLQRRVVTPRPEAWSWIEEARRLRSELPITRQVRRRIQARLRKLLGFAAWPKDVTRHSCATYRLALPGANPVEVARDLGTSTRILDSHYRALVTPAAAERFWGSVASALSGVDGGGDKSRESSG